MKVKNNYASVICLGSFNPSILTPQFLTEVCKFNFAEKPLVQIIPVISNVKFGNVNFIAELEKFQVMEMEIANFKDSKVIGYFERYLEILSYTPVFVCGINLNFSISEYAAETFLEKVCDKNKLFGILGTKEAMLDKKEVMRAEKTSNDWLCYNLTYPAKDNAVSRLHFQKSGDAVTVNFNYEVRELEKEKSRIKNVGKNFEFLISENERLVKEFFS